MISFDRVVEIMYNRGVDASLAIISILCVFCFQVDTASAEETTAEQLYEDAFRLIVEGDYGEAYDRLDEIISMYPGTIYARLAQDRRRRLEELNLSSIKRKKIDQSGRIESVVFSTLYSTWLGMGSARLAKADSGKAIAAGMMIGAPAGLLTSLALTRNAKLSRGQAELINFSGYWGTWQGLGLAIILDKNDDEKTMISSAMAGGLLGILTTSILTRKIDLSLGDASLIHYGGLWGTWLSFLAGFLAGIKDGDDHLALVLLGGNLGAAATAALSSKIEMSLGQASLTSLSGIVGTLVAGGFLLIFQPDSERAIWGTLMAGGILGLVGGGYEVMGSDAWGVSQQRTRATLGQAVSSQTYKVNSKEVRANLLSIRF